jgi:uncharacterized membrane-anchored protein
MTPAAAMTPATTKPAWVSWVAILVPLAVMTGWIAMHAMAYRNSVKVELAIRGYDPRDLLAGHYLRFAVDWGADLCANAPADGAVCVCFGRAPAGKPTKITWNGACSARPPECGAYLQGSCQDRNFDAGLDRYYVPEGLAEKSPTIPPEATIVVALDGRGGAHIAEMRVAGEPLADWVEKQIKPSP